MTTREFQMATAGLGIGFVAGLVLATILSVVMSIGVYDGFKCKRYSPVDASCVLLERSR